MRIILEANADDDLGLALRAARWLMQQPDTQRDAILAYGEGSDAKAFYVKRGKASISSRRCRK